LGDVAPNKNRNFFVIKAVTLEDTQGREKKGGGTDSALKQVWCDKKRERNEGHTNSARFGTKFDWKESRWEKKDGGEKCICGGTVHGTRNQN